LEPCATLGFAVQQANSFDSVLVMDGTYTGAGNFPQIPVSLTVTAVKGASPVFDASAVTSPITFAPDEPLNVSFVALTFANWTQGHQFSVGLFDVGPGISSLWGCLTLGPASVLCGAV
jgi:hypothetical protein